MTARRLSHLNEAGEARMVDVSDEGGHGAERHRRGFRFHGG